MQSGGWRQGCASRNHSDEITVVGSANRVFRGFQGMRITNERFPELDPDKLDATRQAAHPSPGALAGVALPTDLTRYSDGFNGAILPHSSLVPMNDPNAHLQEFCSTMPPLGRRLRCTDDEEGR